MAEFPDALIEQAAKVLRADYESEYDADHIDWSEFADIARAVLEAVADDLRADAWDEGYQAAAGDWCTPGVFGRVSRNPYRERADQINPKEDTRG